MAKDTKNKTQEEAKAERERYIIRKTLEVKYRQRFTIAKEGKLALNRRDYRMMIYRYNEYLKIMADTFEVPTIYDIKAEHFDQKKDVAEMLLISQVYWELAKIHDGSSKSQDKLQLCLQQFIAFTLNMQFQGLNSEIVRKELKKRKFKHKELFTHSLEKIYRESSACYMATFYSADLTMLQTFRAFKLHFLNQHAFSKKLVFHYYDLSPSFIIFLRQHPLAKNVFHFWFKPFLIITFFILRSLGFKLS